MTSWVAGSEIQAWIGLDQIDLTAAQSLADVVTDMLADEINRNLAQVTIPLDIYDSNGTDYILANYWPIRSIGQVTYNGVTVPPAGFNVAGWRLDRFNVRRLNFAGMGKLARGTMNISLTNLVAGYDITQPVGSATGLPARVYQAFRLTASAVFNSQAADPNLLSESTAGVFSGTFHKDGIGSVPPGAITLLSSENRVAP